MQSGSKLIIETIIDLQYNQLCMKVWESVLVLRTLADNEIILRVWRDNIGTSVYETDGELVILHYNDDRQPPVVLHTKQVGCVHLMYHPPTLIHYYALRHFLFSLSLSSFISFIQLSSLKEIICINIF